MPRTYRITGTGASGRRETFTLVADSPGEAEARANRGGMIVTSLREVPGGLLPPAPWPVPLTRKVLAVAVLLLVVAALLAGPALAVVGERRRVHAETKRAYDARLDRSRVYIPTFSPAGGRPRDAQTAKANLDTLETSLHFTYARLGGAALLTLLGFVLVFTAMFRSATPRDSAAAPAAPAGPARV
jgi:hypothetical protein